MTKQRPHILITNDDGIEAQGIKYLWESLYEYCNITIVAPEKEASGSGAGITLSKPLRFQKRSWPRETAAYSVNGKPSDCVKLALSLIFDELPDMIISGINAGSNSGRNVLHSGTVGATIEGAMRGIPGLAFSCVGVDHFRYDRAQELAPKLMSWILDKNFGSGTVFNVNIPESDAFNGVKMCRQGRAYWIEDPTEERLHDGDLHYYLGGKYMRFKEELDSDVSYLDSGYATVVPLYVNDLTHPFLFREHRKEFELEMKEALPTAIS